MTRLDCGGYPGFFVVRADFQQRRRSLYLVRRYLLITCTYLWRLVEEIGSYLWCLVEVDLWCLVVQNFPKSQDFVENALGAPGETLSAPGRAYPAGTAPRWHGPR